MGFFPADNFAVIVMQLLSRITHQDFWPRIPAYFLGPILNQLPASLQPDHAVNAAFLTPFVQGIDTTHCLVVIGIFALVFLTTSVVLTWRRDVLH
jgi:hypothetical protein